MSLGSIKLASATAVAGVTALAFAAAGVEMRTRAAVARLVDGRPGLMVAGATVGYLDQSVTLHGISFDDGRLRMRVGKLRLAAGRDIVGSLGSLLVSPAQAFPTGGGASIDAAPGGATGEAKPAAPGAAPGIATAENVTITYQDVTYTIPMIEVAGTTMSSADLAALLDTAGSESIEARVRRVSAASITIPEIKADSVKGDVEQHWDQQRVLFASITKGKAAIASAGSGTLQTRSAKDTTVAEIGGLQMSGVDMGQIVHVAATDRDDDGEVQLPLAESLIVSAIKISDAGAAPVFTLASVKEAGLKARPLSAPTRATLLSPDQPGEATGSAFVNDILGSISINLLQADDLVVAPPRPDGTAAVPGLGRLSRVTVTGVRDHNFGSVAAQNFVYDAGKDHLSFASFELRDFAAPSVYDGTQAPALGGADLDKLSVNVNTADAGKPEQRLQFDLAHASYVVPNAKRDALPPTSLTTVDDLRITVRPDMSPMLVALGYPLLDLSTKIATSFDAGSQSASLDDWTLSGIGMGSATLKLQLGKVTDAVISRNSEVRKAALAAIVFKGIDLTIRDEGLFDRVLAYRATQDNLSVAQERENAIDLVRNKLPVLAGDPAKLKPVEEAVARFIADPKLPLHVTITSVEGLGAADAGLLNDPNALLDHLAVGATTGR